MLNKRDKEIARMEFNQEKAGVLFYGYDDTKVREEIDKKLEGEEMKPVNRDLLYSVYVPKNAKIKVYRYGSVWTWGQIKPTIVVVNYPQKKLKYAIVVDFIAKKQKYYKNIKLAFETVKALAYRY